MSLLMLLVSWPMVVVVAVVSVCVNELDSVSGGGVAGCCC